MASAEVISGSTAITPPTSTSEIQSTQPPQPSSNLGAGVNDTSTETLRTQSLFGPFPPSAEQSQVDQPTTSTSEAPQMPEAPPPDQIAPTSADRQIGSQTILHFDPLSQEPKNPIESHASNVPDSRALPPLTREKTAPAIGPATDKPTPVPKESEAEGPVLYITLLLSSTGARHPYKLDEKYLRKRNVVVDGNNPINISLYKLKELILRDWRDEWDSKPSSPDSIRLISMGKMLNDKARLSDSGFTNGTTPHIIHMTIKPQEIVDEEDAKMKAAGGSRGEEERSPGCRCIIQ